MIVFPNKIIEKIKENLYIIDEYIKKNGDKKSNESINEIFDLIYYGEEL